MVKGTFATSKRITVNFTGLKDLLAILYSSLLKMIFSKNVSRILKYIFLPFAVVFFGYCGKISLGRSGNNSVLFSSKENVRVMVNRGDDSRRHYMKLYKPLILQLNFLSDNKHSTTERLHHGKRA